MTDKQMTMQEFIDENRGLIDDHINSICNNCNIEDDNDREEWIANDEFLYYFAIGKGVDV
jgi:hypothetical protein